MGGVEGRPPRVNESRKQPLVAAFRIARPIMLRVSTMRFSTNGKVSTSANDAVLAGTPTVQLVTQITRCDFTTARPPRLSHSSRELSSPKDYVMPHFQ